MLAAGDPLVPRGLDSRWRSCPLCRSSNYCLIDLGSNPRGIQVWRRGWDSNPRSSRGRHNWCIQPLCHPSGGRGLRAQATAKPASGPAEVNSGYWNRTVLTGGRGIGGHSWLPSAFRMRAMKAILQATLAAILSGILVGVLLKKKLADATLAALAGRRDVAGFDKATSGAKARLDHWRGADGNVGGIPSWRTQSAARAATLPGASP